MTEPVGPLLLLAMPDGPRRRGIMNALRQHELHIRVCTADSGDEMLRLATEEPPSLLLLDHRFDEESGVPTLAVLREEMGSLPRSALLFERADDPGRERAAESGVIDFVLAPLTSPSGDERQQLDAPLLALIERLITRDVLESRLDATTMQFRALVENSTDGIYILQEGDRIVYANPRFEEMVGYSMETLTGPGFSIRDNIISPESRSVLAERLKRIRAGQPVAPRYEFVALRSDGSTFDAQVSVSYITFRGAPASLGIMRDITERKQFESQLVRKNRELALLQDLAASINEAVELDDILRIGCRRLHDLLKSGATGITLTTSDEAFLELRASEGLPDDVKAALSHVPIEQDSLLAEAVKQGEVQIVHNLKADDRVAFRTVKELGFEGAMVVPVKARTRTLGAAFIFTEAGRPPSMADRELMLAMGYQLGTAIEKASLLEQERASVKSLTALDEIALATASRLEAKEIADTVARAVQRIYGCKRVVLTRLDEEHQMLRPLCALDGEATLELDEVPAADTLLGEALERRSVLVRVADLEHDGPLHPYTEAMFDEGIQAAVAIPVLSDGERGGGLLLGFEEHAPLDAAAVAALGALAPHVAVAMKNADLFEAKKRALDELKAAQDKLVQSEKLRALGELAAGVAHDFNNVLGAILGRAQLLKSQLRDPAMKKHADIIEKAATDGAETVRRIQEIGRQETTDDFVAVDLVEIVQDVVDLTQPRWRDLSLEEGRPVELRTELTEGPLPVAGNPHELREVLINLVHNAVDAMPGGGALTLRVKRQTGPEGALGQIEVEDQGTGMPDDVKERIFDPFFTTKGEKGTGLGLSVSYSIIQRHGGDIEVLSRTEGKDRGTTFVLRLPEVDPASLPPPPSRPPEEPAPREPDDGAEEVSGVPEVPLSGGPAPAPAHSGEGEAEGLTRVLVIDDEENIRDILSDILDTGGYEVETAEDGPSGIALFQSGRFDLVLTDLGLPGMSGYEVAAAVKEKDPTLPVGLVTGWGATLDPERLQKLGIDLILSKPFKFEQVLGLVQEAMATRT